MCLSWWEVLKSKGDEDAACGDVGESDLAKEEGGSHFTPRVYKIADAGWFVLPGLDVSARYRRYEVCTNAGVASAK